MGWNHQPVDFPLRIHGTNGVYIYIPTWMVGFYDKLVGNIPYIHGCEMGFPVVFGFSFCFFLFPPFLILYSNGFVKKGWRHLPSLQPPTRWKSTQLTVIHQPKHIFPINYHNPPVFKENPFQPTRLFVGDFVSQKIAQIDESSNRTNKSRCFDRGYDHGSSKGWLKF